MDTHTNTIGIIALASKERSKFLLCPPVANRAAVLRYSCITTVLPSTQLHTVSETCVNSGALLERFCAWAVARRVASPRFGGRSRGARLLLSTAVRSTHASRNVQRRRKRVVCEFYVRSARTTDNCDLCAACRHGQGARCSLHVGCMDHACS